MIWLRGEANGNFLWSMETGYQYCSSSEGLSVSQRKRLAWVPTTAMPGACPPGYLLSGPLAVGFQLTRYCNLRCGYCFAEPRYSRIMLSSPILMEVCEAVMGLSPLTVWISGGEPTIVRELPAVLAKFSAADFPTAVDTNGVSLDPAVVDAFAAHDNATLRISIDAATAAVHNRIRGSFKSTWSALHRCVQRGAHVEVNTVVTRVNEPHLDALYERLLGLGVLKWNLFELVQSGWAHERTELRPCGDAVRSVLDRNIAAGRPLRIAVVHGNRPRTMVLISEQGDLYTVDGTRRAAAGNILEVDPVWLWGQLALDRDGHLRKYLGTREGG